MYNKNKTCAHAKNRTHEQIIYNRMTMFTRICTARDREMTEFDTILRYLVGRDRDIDIFTGSV